jgi:hypothetical protein
MPSDEVDQQWLDSKADKIRGLVNSIAENVIAIGCALREVRDALPYGQFGEWLQVEFHMSARTAHRYVAIVEVFTSDTVSQLDLAALHVLRSTPAGARSEATERGRRRERITKSKAREIASRYRGGTTAAPALSEPGDEDTPFSWRRDGVNTIAGVMVAPIDRRPWRRDGVNTIASVMVRSDRPKAERLVEALTAVLRTRSLN